MLQNQLTFLARPKQGRGATAPSLRPSTTLRSARDERLFVSRPSCDPLETNGLDGHVTVTREPAMWRRLYPVNIQA
jgi:hypothetical protein